MWEAVYLIEGCCSRSRRLRPGTVHADTQGQSFPVFALAHLFGFDLMPRIRNWKDLNFYRPSADARYRHIDALFGEPGRNVIDWDLIETHYDDLMRVVLSIQAGKISSVTLLRRLSTYSRRNNLYKAFREVGRVIRTVQLLRYLSDPQLRARTTAATNKVESYNHFVVVVPLRQPRDHRRQRPRRAGEDHQVRHPPGQLRDLPHRRRHDRRHPRPDRRGLDRSPPKTSRSSRPT